MVRRWRATGHALSRAARQGTGRRRHGPLPAASRVLLAADRRGGARAGIRSADLLAVARERDVVFVREKLEPSRPRYRAVGRVPTLRRQWSSSAVAPRRLAAADMLRREGYAGPVTMISADSDAPVDRPNLSKDYLAGEAQEDWMPLWPPELYAERRVDLVLEPARVVDRSTVAAASCWMTDPVERIRRAADRDRRRSRASDLPAPMLHGCSTSVRSPTAARSSRAHGSRGTSWSSARVSSDSKSPPRFGLGTSPSTWSLPRACRSNA